MMQFALDFSVRRLRRLVAGKVCLFLFLCAFGTPAVALTCTSNVAAGNWNTAGTWTACGGVVPTAADDVVINAGQTVTLDTSPTVRTLNISGCGDPSR